MLHAAQIRMVACTHVSRGHPVEKLRTDLKAVAAHAGDRDDAEEWQAPTSLPVRIDAALQLFIRVLGSRRLTRSDAMQCT